MKDRTLPLDFTVRPSAVPSEREGQAPHPGTPASPAGPAREAPRPFTVAELDRAIHGSLEVTFERAVWVEGEVSAVRAPASGHAYFTLKDEREEASVDCVVYKTNLTVRVRELLRDGSRVRLRGRPAFWAPRGRLQFVSDRAVPAGRGALLEALEKLKNKLAGEGLFAPERKRRLPREPRTVGVVTSEHGAAIHDICKVAFRRGGARVLLAPALVQGPGAADSVARALVWLQRVPDVDVIIVGRGGGSSDDLAAFNDETLVRTVAACRVPVISAVGHEVDVTLVDFASDARAATPSQAAEMAVPDAAARRAGLAHVRRRLEAAIGGRLAEGRARVERGASRLRDPRLMIASFQQTQDDRCARLERGWSRSARARRDEVLAIERRLSGLHPVARVAREKAEIGALTARLRVGMHRSLDAREGGVARLSGRLDAMSPLSVLARGYAIATRQDGRALREKADVSPGERVLIRLHRARLDAEVVSVEELPTTEHPAKRGPS